MPAFDLIIRNGTIVDGTGAPRFAGDIAVKDGLIAAVGKVSGDASSEIDAGGNVIAPGWVDIHTHYDGQATWGRGNGAVIVARGHHRRHGQLRRRLCPCRARPA